MAHGSLREQAPRRSQQWRWEIELLLGLSGGATVVGHDLVAPSWYIQPEIVLVLICGAANRAFHLALHFGFAMLLIRWFGRVFGVSYVFFLRCPGVECRSRNVEGTSMEKAECGICNSSL